MGILITIRDCWFYQQEIPSIFRGSPAFRDVGRNGIVFTVLGGVQDGVSLSGFSANVTQKFITSYMPQKNGMMGYFREPKRRMHLIAHFHNCGETEWAISGWFIVVQQETLSSGIWISLHQNSSEKNMG